MLRLNLNKSPVAHECQDCGQRDWIVLMAVQVRECMAVEVPAGRRTLNENS